MASYPHNASFRTPKPWPAYFIVRTTGEVVPLIGVDELPIGVDLVGIPRALDLEDTIGMLNLGIQRRSEVFYQVVQRERKASVVDAASKLAMLELDTKGKAAEAQQTSIQSSSRSMSSTTPSTNSRTSPSSPASQTQICRHWCTHGICKWGQQCRYGHAMPMTLPGLQDIGLNDWPQWYRTLNPGYFAKQSTHLEPNFGRRGKGRACSGGNECCSGMNLAVDIAHASAKRLRAAAKLERAARNDDLGEQVVARLRGLPKKPKAVRSPEEYGEMNASRPDMLERATIKDAKDWEEEGSEVAEESKETDIKGGEVSVGKISLLD